MIEIDDYKTLYEVIREGNETGDLRYSGEDLTYQLRFETKDKVSGILERLSKFAFNSNPNNSIDINANLPSVHIFEDIADYRLRIKLVNGEFKNNILILNFNGDSFFYRKETKVTYRNFQEDDQCHLFSNTFHYSQLIDFLKESEKEDDNKFHFVDHFNKDNRRIILISSLKQGKLEIGFEQSVPDFRINKSIKTDIERFIEAFTQKEFPRFIKAEMFNVIPSCSHKEERLKYFIENLPSIIERAEQNFDIYLNDLSLDNFKKQFLDFMIRYFGLFRDILSKLTTQVLEFPLSISAATFATYKVGTNEYLSYAIVIAFVIFGLYSLFMLGAYNQDIIENNNLFDREYKDLAKNSFFIKYPDELEYFESTKSFVEKRYKFLKTNLIIYSIVLSVTNSLFVFFVLNQFKGKCISIIIPFLLLVSSIIVICKQQCSPKISI